MADHLQSHLFLLLHIGPCQYDLISQWKGRRSVSDRLTSSLLEEGLVRAQRGVEGGGVGVLGQ